MRCFAFATLCILTGADLSAQTGSLLRPVVASSDEMRATIAEIGPEDVHGRDRVRFEHHDDSGGDKVILELWGVPDGSSACVLVNEISKAAARAYCVPVEPGQSRVAIRRVVFGEGFSQGREFSCRSVVFRAAPPSGELNLADWLDRSLTEPDKKTVTILKRVVVDSGTVGVAVTTIGGETIDGREVFPVDPTVTITGTWRSPGPLSCRDRNGLILGEPCLFVAGHAIGRSRWRVIGIAEVGRNSWIVHDARIAEPGEPLQTEYEIEPFLASHRIPLGDVDRSLLDQIRIGVSPGVRVSVRFAPVVRIPSQPEVRCTSITTTAGRKQLLPDVPTRLGRESAIEVECEADRPPQSSSLYLAAVALEGTSSRISGPALLAGNRWLVKLSKQATRQVAAGARLYAFFSPVKGIDPDMPVEAWANHALVVSRPVTVKGEQVAEDSDEASALTITKIAGRSVSRGEPLDVPTRLAVEGETESDSPDDHVCIAFRNEKQDYWNVRCETSREQNHWMSPSFYLNTGEPIENESGTWNLLAFVTDRKPPEKVSLTGLHSYAHLFTSQYELHLRQDQTRSSAPSQSALVGWTAWIAQMTFIAMLLSLLEYCCRGVSTFAGALASRLERASRSARSKFVFLQRSDYTATEVRGVLFIVVGIIAMFCYFPVYRTALRQVFSIPLPTAGALALTLIIFNGAVGAIFEASLEGTTGVMRVFTSTLFLLVGACLWLFQSAMYFLYYLGKTSAEPIAMIMALAAFFMSASETAIFFFGFRRGSDSIFSALLHALMVPFNALAGSLRILEEVLLKCPSRADQIDPVGRTLPVPASEERGAR